jgi:site-specific DNA-cytosine methylase
MIKLLYIDLFCGAGGTSTGVENARYADEQCAKVIACVNHDANAIASHTANHPDALHFTEVTLVNLVKHGLYRKIYFTFKHGKSVILLE